MPEWSSLLLIVLATAGAAFVQGYAGFGFGIVTVGLLAALLPAGLLEVTALATLLATATMTAFLALSRSRKPVAWRHVARLVAGIALGLPLGLWFVASFSEQPVARLALGGLLLAFAVHAMVGTQRRYRLPPRAAPPLGMLGGFISGAFSTGGPPLVVYLYSQTDDPRDMKATVKATFLITCLYRLGVLSVAKPAMMLGLIPTALLCLPAVLAMLFLGHRLSMRAGVATFHAVVYGLIGLLGVLTAGRAVASLLA